MTSLNSLLQKLLKLKFTNIKDIEEKTVSIEAFGTTFEQTQLIVHADIVDGIPHAERRSSLLQIRPS